jgi:hypothetical protein
MDNCEIIGAPFNIQQWESIVDIDDAWFSEKGVLRSFQRCVLRPIEDRAAAAVLTKKVLINMSHTYAENGVTAASRSPEYRVQMATLCYSAFVAHPFPSDSVCA